MTFTVLILSVLQSKWLLYLCLGIVLLMQLWLLLRSANLTKKRLWIRVCLNVLVWLVVFLFVFQPELTYTSQTNKVILTDSNVPKTYVQKVKDSVRAGEVLSNAEFIRLIGKNPHFIDQLGHIFLLGQNFSSETLGRLSQKNLTWLPYFSAEQLQDLHWNGIVKKGDIQEVNGKIAVGDTHILRLKYANKVLDSLVLEKGLNAFHFSFPAFTIGRTETTLTLDNEPLQHIHFYSHTPQPFNVLFILQNPDFESKNLSEWLGKNNHRVEIITTIAKDAQSKVSINKASQSKTFNADVVITDPTNATHALVKKAVNEGKSVLFINAMAPEQDTKVINQALGTNWRIKRTSNEQSVNIADNLTALPYTLETSLNQQSVGTYPIAIQKKVGKIGLSLLNETFPLKLSGDSLTYNKIWASVLQQLSPAQSDNVLIQAPVFVNTQTSVTINNPSVTTNKITLAGDTTQLSQSAVNPLSFSTDYIFRQSGWQTLQDSLNIFVDEASGGLQQSKQIQQMLLAHQKFENNSSVASAQVLTTTLPDWLWYVLIILGLAALWLEPKLSF